MTDSPLQSKAIDALVVLNAAVRNLRLYPQGSAMIRNSLDKAHRAVAELFTLSDEVVYAEAEKTLLVCGRALNDKETEKPQVQAFLGVMRNLGIRTVTLRKGMDRDQLQAFLETIGRKPEEVQAQGGLAAIVNRVGWSHILIDAKIFVALDKGQKVVAGQQADACATTEDGVLAEACAEGATAQRVSQIADLKSAVTDILKGSLVPLEDRRIVQALPGTLVQLVAKGGTGTFEALLDKLGQAIMDETPAIRANATRVLARCLERLPEDRQAESVHRLLPQILGLTEREDDVSPSIEKLFEQLQRTLQSDLRHQRLAARKRILEAVGRMAASPTAAEAMRRMMRDLAASIATDAPAAAMDAELLDARSERLPESSPATASSETRIPPETAVAEAEVEALAAAGKTEEAVAALLALITVEARAKRFTSAERLRDKLYEIDAMALGQIIAAGEMIEAEKSQAVDADHLDVFAPLYTRLTEAERNALYHAMTTAVFAPADTLIAQSRGNDRLCFINQGDVKIVYRLDSREVLVQQLGAGSLVGAESFFNATVATVSAIALSRVQVGILDRAGLDALGGGFPGLVSKLQDYSLGLDVTAELLRRKGMDRRTQKRVPLAGKVTVQIQDQQNRASGRPFTGTLADLSIGGLSFFIKSAKPETARLLLGRRLGLNFGLPPPSPVSAVEVSGTVIGANYLLENDYAIHVRFDRRLDPAIIDALDPDARPASEPGR